MNKKILVVDDDAGILDALGLILSDEGYYVKKLISATGIMEKIDETKPDLILIDVLLSGIDGRVITKKLKEDKKKKNIPVIMMSAHPSAQNGVMNSGANDFLTKPFEIEDLLELIKKYTT